MPPSALTLTGHVKLTGCYQMPGHPAIFAHKIGYCEHSNAAFPWPPASARSEEPHPPRYPSGGVPPPADRPQGAEDCCGGHIRRESSTGLIRPTSRRDW
jgi:hypothetical protein